MPDQGSRGRERQWARFKLNVIFLFPQREERSRGGSILLKNTGLGKFCFQPRWSNKDWIYPPNGTNKKMDKT